MPIGWSALCSQVSMQMPANYKNKLNMSHVWNIKFGNCKTRQEFPNQKDLIFYGTNFRLERFLMLEKVLDILSQVLRSIFCPLSIARSLCTFCSLQGTQPHCKEGVVTPYNFASSHYSFVVSQIYVWHTWIWWSVVVGRRQTPNDSLMVLILTMKREEMKSKLSGPDQVVLGAVIIEGLEEKYYEKEE